jgi:hypothetical protein
MNRATNAGPRPTKAELLEQREQVRMLAIQIGYRAAARECGLSEDRVRQWAHRYGWSLPHKLARSAFSHCGR